MSGNAVPSGASEQLVAVHFTDGEVVHGYLNLAKLEEHSFWLRPLACNARLVQILQAGFKYFVLQDSQPGDARHEEDPNDSQTEKKVVVRFLDGECMRTRMDDSFGAFKGMLRMSVQSQFTNGSETVFASPAALKGIFHVERWDSRSDDDRLVSLVPPLSPRQTDPGRSRTSVSAIPENIAKLAVKLRKDLVQVADADLGSRDPVRFRAALERHLTGFLVSNGQVLARESQGQVLEAIMQEAFGHGPLDALLQDRSVTEIMVNGPKSVFIERNGCLEQSSVEFEDEAQLIELIRRMAGGVGRRIDESNPMVDARLRDGSRLNAIMPPAAVQGAVLTIRKFRSSLGNLKELVDEDTMSTSMALFLAAAVQGRLNILISGGTGSGKTTTLNALGSLIPRDQRVITIEDAAELQIQHPNLVSLEYRPPNVEGRGEITIRQLLRNSLRMRPNRIVVGEVRGGEALDMLHAMNTGHEGSMSTIHANTGRDALIRLETMVLSAAPDLPPVAIRNQLESAINILVHQERLIDGSRRLTEISEVVAIHESGPVLRPLFVGRWDPHQGFRFSATGAEPASLARLAQNRVELDRSIFQTDRPLAAPSAAS
jgi:pilus assembly protein CpaF